MTRMLRETSAAVQQQNSPAPWEGAGQRMNGGATDERARQRRGMRDIAGEECGDAHLRGIDVSIARADARHPRPQPDGTAGHDRTRSEAVATPETATGPGRSGGYASVVTPERCVFASETRQGRIRIQPPTRIRKSASVDE